jgi:DNA invertase Pin-like site-specific DNA recombinase
MGLPASFWPSKPSPKKGNYQIVRVFREVKSGTVEGGDRPAMSRMIELLRGHDSCRTVIIERLDRCARDLVIQEGTLPSSKD